MEGGGGGVVANVKLVACKGAKGGLVQIRAVVVAVQVGVVF